ncbi:GGDEF domain-containing protein [Aerosakkonemataceae cyanobacterium BLCC-F154]|uniref:GGDEF domain-containing protein n=1 Tax=Floridaenema fluviatile BLCC-F154 TaxID=3153640 RepID=A0ABV4Y500_9CYAN
MNLDIRTILLLGAVLLILQIIPLILLFALANRYKGIKHWLLGNIIASLGYFLIVFRGFFSDFISIILANILIIGGYSLGLQGISVFTEQKFPRYIILALNIVFWVIHFHFTYIVDSLSLRIINVSWIGFIISGFSAYQLINNRDKRLIISSRFTAIIFLFQSSLTLARIIATLSDRLSNSLFDLNLDGFQVFYFIATFINSFLMSVGFIGMVCQKLYQDLNILAECDFLTNTLNRRAIEHQIDREIAYCQRENRKITLILMDIDRFKSINDNYGHDSGDLVLKHFTQTLTPITRQEDLLGRWGGEEFLIVSRVDNVENAVVLAERLRSAIQNEKVIVHHTIITYTISLGVAVYGVHGQTKQELIIAADRALYDAKNSGRNRVAIAQPYH